MKIRRKFFDYESVRTLKSESAFKRAYERNQKDHSAVTDAMIAAGRGHWRNAETSAAAKQGDSLAILSEKLSDESRALGYHADSFFGQPPYMVHGKIRMTRKRNPKLLHHRAHYAGGLLAQEQDRVYFSLDVRSDGNDYRKGEPAFITMIPTGAGDDATVYVQSILHPYTPPFPVALKWLSPMPGKKGWPRGTKPKGNPRQRATVTTKRGRATVRDKSGKVVAGYTGKRDGPGYKGVAKKLAASLNRKRNPMSCVIALYMNSGKRLTYDDTRKRFTDNTPPSLYRTSISAKNRADNLIAQHPHLRAYKITVEAATQKERGPVFGARPVRNPKGRAKFGIGVNTKAKPLPTLTLFKYAGMPTADTHPQFGAVIGMFTEREQMMNALGKQLRGSTNVYKVVDETRPKK